MVGDTVEKKLYDAASNGDVATLVEMLREDTPLYLLDAVSFARSRSLLHVATMRGQLRIVNTITANYPELARNLDSQNSSPLHMAAAQGHLEVARALLLAAPEVCWWRDWRGMNPIHVAAVNGHVKILELLISSDRLPAAERLDRGQTVLHLSVKHRRPAAFEFLMENLGELVRVKDDDGETAVQLAFRLKQVEAIRYLVVNNKIDEISKNSEGKTVVQIYEESFPDRGIEEIKRIRALHKKSLNEDGTFMRKISDMTMVVVVLIATMAFQAAVSPPGGVWQDDSSPLRKAGEAVMASNRPKIFKTFKQANTVAFASSLVTIFLLTTGFPSNNLIFTTIVLLMMWMSLASIAFIYGASLMVITPNMETHSLSLVINIVVIASVTLYLSIYNADLVIACGERIKRTKLWQKFSKNYSASVVALRRWLDEFSQRLMRHVISHLSS